MTRRVLAEIAAAAAVLGFVFTLIIPPITLSDGEQQIGDPGFACPPYTDLTRTLPSGIVECSVSSGETLRYNPTTGQWTDVFIPNTAMEAPR